MKSQLCLATALAAALLFTGVAHAADPLIEPTGKAVFDKAFAARMRGSEPIPVVVTVALARGAAVDADLAVPARRAAAKATIAATLDAAVAALVPGKSVMKLTTSPRFAVNLTPKEITALATDARVVSIAYDTPVTKTLTQSIPLVQANTVHAAGGTGTGRTVAIIDDGAQRSHPFLGNRHIAAGEACFIANTNGCPNGTGQQTGPGAAEAKPGQSHGTHVAGIAIGRRTSGSTGPATGVANAARYIPINVFGPFDSTPFSNLDRAFEHVEELVLTNNNVHNIASVNMSIGGGGSSSECDANLPATKAILTRLRNLGVPVTISAGNGGNINFMGAPACVSTAVSVASTSKVPEPSSFTDINRTTDLFAPGGEFGDCIVSSVQTNAFSAFCGTSMASPHVAGAFAVLKQLFPNATPAQMLAALQRTGQPIADIVHTKPMIKLERARRFLLSPTPPSNDLFTRAPYLPVNGYVATNNAYATRQAGERRHVTQTDGQTIWYKLRAPNGGSVTIDTLGSDFDTVLAVYQETSLATLGTPVAANNDIDAAQKSSRLTFTADRNRLYYIVVGGAAAGGEGHVIVNVSTTPAPPPNDAFASSRAVGAPETGAVALRSTNVSATTEPGEQLHDLMGRTIWYRFRPTRSGRWVVDTNQSNFDTVIAVYRGTTLANLQLIGVDDDGGNDLQSRLAFTATAGTLYYVQVGGYLGDQGDLRLRIASPPVTSGLDAEVEVVSSRR